MSDKTGVVNIQGKQYKTVILRVNEFRESCKATDGWGIVSELLYDDDKRAVVQARILDPGGRCRSTDGKVYDFSGPQMTATLETGELVEEPNVAMATKAYLPINNFTGSGTMAVKHRYAPTVNQTTSSATSIKSTGQLDLRTTNKRLAFNIALSGFSKIGNKIEVNIEKSGER